MNEPFPDDHILVFMLKCNISNMIINLKVSNLQNLATDGHILCRKLHFYRLRNAKCNFGGKIMDNWIYKKVDNKV